jgi:hypothetical protein
MIRVNGTKLFKFTSPIESANYAELKAYFEQMYFAN